MPSADIDSKLAALKALGNTSTAFASQVNAILEALHTDGDLFGDMATMDASKFAALGAGGKYPASLFENIIMQNEIQQQVRPTNSDATAPSQTAPVSELAIISALSSLPGLQAMRYVDTEGSHPSLYSVLTSTEPYRVAVPPYCSYMLMITLEGLVDTDIAFPRISYTLSAEFEDEDEPGSFQVVDRHVDILQSVSTKDIYKGILGVRSRREDIRRRTPLYLFLEEVIATGGIPPECYAMVGARENDAITSWARANSDESPARWRGTGTFMQHRMLLPTKLDGTRLYDGSSGASNIFGHSLAYPSSASQEAVYKSRMHFQLVDMEAQGLYDPVGSHLQMRYYSPWQAGRPQFTEIANATPITTGTQIPGGSNAAPTTPTLAGSAGAQYSFTVPVKIGTDPLIPEDPDESLPTSVRLTYGTHQGDNATITDTVLAGPSTWLFFFA